MPAIAIVSSLRRHCEERERVSSRARRDEAISGGPNRDVAVQTFDKIRIMETLYQFRLSFMRDKSKRSGPNDPKKSHASK
ncbi:MAG: hypothetical protein ACREFU_01090 [Acetobacteraceae bacterium]